jgi:hyperosmotically inducible protein
MSLGQHIPIKKTLATSLVILFASSGFAANAPTDASVKANTAAPAADADNTKLNQRDASGKTLTPEDQSRGTAMDVELTRKIRQELVDDKSLSTDAQNVKIITLDGIVTIRGPVASSAEKAKVDSLAKKVSGVKKVDNQTEVKTKTY